MYHKIGKNTNRESGTYGNAPTIEILRLCVNDGAENHTLRLQEPLNSSSSVACPPTGPAGSPILQRYSIPHPLAPGSEPALEILDDLDTWGVVLAMIAGPLATNGLPRAKRFEAVRMMSASLRG